MAMTVITEQYLRSLYRNMPFTTFQVERGQIMTPAARQFLNERQVQVERSEGGGTSSGIKAVSCAGTEMAIPAPVQQPETRYVSALDGGQFAAKPESMTHLKGNRLVPKDHPRIIFRGKLDHFQSTALLVQAGAHEAGKKSVVAGLEEILTRIREVMKAEVLEQPLADAKLFGMTAEELRKISHNPKKYFGIDHLLPDYTMGRTVLDLNQLRSQVREVEVASVKAFRSDSGVERTDIVEALNRLSSALYVMMIREQSGKSGDINQ